jgi:hypothetical protein
MLHAFAWAHGVPVGPASKCAQKGHVGCCMELRPTATPARDAPAAANGGSCPVWLLTHMLPGHAWGPSLLGPQNSPTKPPGSSNRMHQLRSRYQRPGGLSTAMGGLQTTLEGQISRNSGFDRVPSLESDQLQLQSVTRPSNRSPEPAGASPSASERPEPSGNGRHARRCSLECAG